MSDPSPLLPESSGIDVVDDENPWPGLASFEERYQDFFYGRDREEKILLRRVLRGRLTILTGRSGMGKTSILRAGLFPRLRREKIFPVYVNLVTQSGGSGLSRQTFDAIQEQAENEDHPVEAPIPWPQESLWEYLHRQDDDFWSHDNRLLTPLLAFDRFEEILVARGRPGPLGREIEAFLAELADLVEGRIPAELAERWKALPRSPEAIDPGYHPYKILLSLREDFLADLEDWSDEYLPSTSRNRLRLYPMNGERALEAVLRPGRGLIEQEVAEEIVRWVAGEGNKEGPTGEDAPLGRLTIEPALLSLVCRELNSERLKRQRAGETGAKITAGLLATGKATIIEDFYTRCMKEVKPEVREFVEDRLLLPAGRRDSVALQLIPERFREDLKRLQELRLLRIETHDDVERVELTHDVLTPAVRASRDVRRQREAEERIEREWHAREVEKLNRQIEEVKIFAKRLVIGSIVVLVLIAIGLVGLAKWRTAQQATVIATEGRKTEEKERRLADLWIAASLVEKGRAAEGLAFLARAARVTPVSGEESTQPDPLVLAARSAIANLLLRRNWPLPAADLHPEGESLLANPFDTRGRYLLLSVSGPRTHLWVDGTSHDITASLSFSVIAADLSPDGQRLVMAAADGRWQLWDTEALRPLSKVVLPDNHLHLQEIILSHDGKTVLTLLENGRFRLWDAKTGRALSATLHHGTLANQFLWAELSPDGRFAVTAANDYTAQVWAVPSGAPVGKPMRHSGQIYTARFSADGRKLVTASADHTAQVWDVRTGRPVGVPLKHGDVVHWAELSPDGRTVATASFDTTARLWDAATGQAVSGPMLHQGRVQSVRFSPDGRLVVSASSDGTARLWDAHFGCPTHEPLRLGQPLDSALFSPDGQSVSTQAGSLLRRWYVAPSRAREAVLQPGRPETEPGPEWVCQSSQGPGTDDLSTLRNAAPPEGIAVRLNRAGTVLAVGAGRQVRLYRVGEDKALSAPPRVFQTAGQVTSVALGPDGSRLAVAWNKPAGAQVWDSTTGEKLSDLTGGPFISLDFSADGQKLAAARSDATVDLIPLAGGPRTQVSLKTTDTTDTLSAVRLSPNGQELSATYRGGFTALLWGLGSTDNGGILLKDSHLGAVFSAELSPDGQRLVTAAADSIARETQIAKKEILSRLVHPVSVWSADYGPETGDARRIVTVAADNRVRLWDPNSAQVIGSPLVHPEQVVAAHFLPDGQSLVTVSKDGAVRLWDTPKGSPEVDNPLADLAEAVGGYQVNKQGVAVDLPEPIKSLQELRKKYAGARKDQGSAASLLRWFFADRSSRTFSPLQPLRPHPNDRP